MTRIAAVLLGVISSISTAHESLWIEAEHLEGTKGYCWPMGQNPKTEGNWGISGPGWASEWTQGGESNFMSIACGADDDKAVASLNIDVPIAGAYQVWVRFRDNRGMSSRFQVRLTSAGAQPTTMWDPLESTCRHASLSIL